MTIDSGINPVEIIISLGVAFLHGNHREFLAEADGAFHETEAAGKNCLVIASTEGATPA